MSEVTDTRMDSRDRTSLAYPIEPPAPDGSVVEVAPGVFWARMPMPMALDHINVYLLRGEHGWTVVDTGLNTETTRGLWQHIVATKLDGLPLRALVCTHWHNDHAGLSGWLTQHYDIPLYMTHGEYYVMLAYASPPPDEWPAEMRSFYSRSGMPAERIERMFAAMRKGSFQIQVPRAFRRLRAGSELVVGGRRWRVMIGEGHSPEHACLYDAEGKILLAGDQLLPRITTNVMVTEREPEANPLKLWLDSTVRLDECVDDTLVLPSHGDVFRGVHTRTRELREHHRRELDTLRAFVREHGPCTSFEAMEQLFPKLHGVFDDILALGEATAHLAWLRYAGEFSRTLDDTGVYRYEALQ